MKLYDVLIIGGGAAGMSCALVLGSAKQKPYALAKKIGIIIHQRTSSLQRGLYNNVLGLKPGTLGSTILKEGKQQIKELYPHVDQIEDEKALKITGENGDFEVTTNRNCYHTKLIVVAIGAKIMLIDGLQQYLEPHKMLPPHKKRLQLKNTNHKVVEGIYVAGVLAGWRSQFSIAIGSGAQVATDILTLWNNGEHSMIHDKIES